MCQDRMNKNIVWSSVSLLLYCPSEIFPNVTSVSGKADESTASAKMKSWLGVKNPAVLRFATLGS